MPFFPPSGGAVTDVTFPLSGTGASGTPLIIGPWLGTHKIYVSPDGDDANSGISQETAVQNPGVGYDKLAALSGGSGGTLSISHGTTGCLWIRNDGLLPTNWRTSMPVLIEYTGGPTAGQFAYEPSGEMINPHGPPYDRFTPGVWICSSGVPIVIRNLMGGTPATGIRAGWDYRRKRSNQAIDLANITSWARNNSVTTQVPIGGDADGVVYQDVPTAVVTVALPTGIAITGAARVGTTVTLTFASALPVPLPISAPVGQPIFVTSSDSDFPGGTKVLTANTETTLTYTEAGAAVTSGAIGTWQSHGLMPRDRVEVTSTSAEVCATAYKVVSVNTSDATKFTVSDYYGNISGRTPTITVSNPGQYVGQNRGIPHGTGMLTIDNYQGLISTDSPDTGLGGPNIDYGLSADGRFLVTRANANGGNYPQNILDPDRSAWLLMDGGATSPTGGQVFHCRPNSGGIRIFGNDYSNWLAEFKDIKGDAPIAYTPVPVVQIVDKAGLGFFTFDSCINTDNAGIANVVVPEDATVANVSFLDCGGVIGPGVRTGMTAWIGSNWLDAGTPTPLQLGQSGFWAKKRIAGRHPAQWRTAGGITTASYVNYCPSPADWTPLGGGAITAGQADPFGGTGAFKITGSGDANIGPVSMGANATGDRIVFSSMFRRDGGTTGDIVYTVSNFLNGLDVRITNDIIQAGWQWLVGYGTLTGSSAGDITALYRNSGTTYHYNPTLIRVPASVSDDEVAEYVETLRPQPAYLAPGMDGNSTGRKLVAHGGLGTAAKYVVGVASGQITLTGVNTKAVELFDESGNSLGVAVLQGFTVNP